MKNNYMDLYYEMLLSDMDKLHLKTVKNSSF